MLTPPSDNLLNVLSIVISCSWLVSFAASELRVVEWSSPDGGTRGRAAYTRALPTAPIVPPDVEDDDRWPTRAKRRPYRGPRLETRFSHGRGRICFRRRGAMAASLSPPGVVPVAAAPLSTARPVVVSCGSLLPLSLLLQRSLGRLRSARQIPNCR